MTFKMTITILVPEIRITLCQGLTVDCTENVGQSPGHSVRTCNWNGEGGVDPSLQCHICVQTGHAFAVW